MERVNVLEGVGCRFMLNSKSMTNTENELFRASSAVSQTIKTIEISEFYVSVPK